ncbi:MAG: DNA polymerase III subunit delta [Cyclobacteriaceae bacterium]|nr:DNA polymerase III subunit delta [Cyclobacteriaceae bacterium]
MKEASQVLKQMKAGQYAPCYFLHGEEPYYIDLIADYIEEHALDEAARGFNQVVLYGKDVKMSDVLNNAKRYPMMSDRQVVIVKEAQNIPDLNKEVGDKQLVQYLENPLPSTILVFCHKHKKLDQRKALAKAIDKHAMLLTSNKLYDNQLPDWIKAYFAQKEFKITDKGVFMLSEYIGNNLQRLANEIDKMLINFKEKVQIDDHIIQKFVGISKEYNSFELQKAVAMREITKANKILIYFEADPKNNPAIPIISLFYGFFSKLLVVHCTADKSENNLASVLKVNRFFIKDYLIAARHYPLQKVLGIVRDLRHADLQTKGVNASLSDGEILKELVFKIMH